MPFLHHWNDVGEQAASPAVRKRKIDGAGADLTQVAIVAGTQADRHSHAFEQFVHVVSGAGTLETKEGVKRFSAGSIFHFPPDTWHAATFEEDTILVETNLVAPAR